METGYVLDSKLLGERIRELRKQKGLSGEQLAEKVMLGGKASVSKYERGLVPNISADTLLRFADVLECEPDYLLGRIDHPRRDISEIAEKLPLSYTAIEALVALREEIEYGECFEYESLTGKKLESPVIISIALDYIIKGFLLADSFSEEAGAEQLWKSCYTLAEAIIYRDEYTGFPKKPNKYTISFEGRSAANMAVEGARYEASRNFGLFLQAVMTYYFAHDRAVLSRFQPFFFQCDIRRLSDE